MFLITQRQSRLMIVSLPVPNPSQHPLCSWTHCRGCRVNSMLHLAPGVNCTIFLGPIKGSIFVRDCSNCRLVVSCQQFRSRDCHDCEVLLHVGSVPIIESTKAIAFGNVLFALLWHAHRESCCIHIGPITRLFPRFVLPTPKTIRVCRPITIRQLLASNSRLYKVIRGVKLQLDSRATNMAA